MVYSFIINEEAIKELTEAFLWYEEQQFGLGKEFRTKIDKKLNQICSDPFQSKVSNNRFHEALTDKFPYLVVYFVDDKNSLVVVTGIFHTSRNPKNKFKKARLK